MRRLIIVSVALLAVVVLGDRAVCWTAERQLASRIQQSEALADAPGVTIGGFPLATQAAAGRYDEVGLTFHDITGREGVRVHTLTADLRGLRIPMSDVLAGRVTQVPVDSADAVAHVTFADLQAAMSRQVPPDRLAVRLAAAGSDRVRVTGTLNALVTSLQLSAEARLVVRNGQLGFTVLPESLNGVPPALRTEVASLLDVMVPISPLPMGFQATGVRVGDDGVTVAVAARNLVLTRH